ncbi:MAG: Uma2 family endonuclease [Polyangiaceae bacterium]
MAPAAARKTLDPSAPNDPAVVAAFRAVPDTMVAEIVDGELHTLPRPARPHTNTASMLGGELHGPFRRGTGGPGGWVILDEPEIHLGPKPDIVVPDLAGWRRDRMADAVGAADAPPHYEMAPDWVCEIPSPSTEALDRGKKMRIYRREGVHHAWLMNPLSRTLEVYRLEGGRWMLLDTFEDDSVVRAEPFDAIELSLSVLWER